MSFMSTPKQMLMAYEDPAAPHTPYAIRANDTLSETQHFGSAGLKGSPRSYLKIVRAILRGGELDGQRILKRETVDLMFKEQLTTDEQRQAFQRMAAINFDPSIRKANGNVDPATTHGHGGGLHAESPTGKALGTLSWSGLAVRCQQASCDRYRHAHSCPRPAEHVLVNRPDKRPCSGRVYERYAVGHEARLGRLVRGGAEAVRRCQGEVVRRAASPPILTRSL